MRITEETRSHHENTNFSIGILGCSGFIGSGLMHHAVTSGIHAKGISRSLPEDLNASELRHSVTIGDVNNYNTLSTFFKSIDIVVDCASSLKPSSASDSVYLEQAVLLDERIQLAAAQGISKYIYVSSGGALYPASMEKATETSTLRPSSKYGLGKELCETIIRFYSNMRTLQVVSARASNPFGFHHKSRFHGFINIFVRNMLKNEFTTVYGDPDLIQKDFIYIDDFSEALLLLAHNDTSGHSAINVGHGSTHSLSDIITTASEELNKPPLIKLTSAMNYDKMQFVLDTELLHNLTGFKPKHNLSQGIRKTIEWESLRRAS